jgi:hypothetical protein
MYTYWMRAITCNLELPVAVHVGCVTVPAVGADGVAGCALTTIFDDTADVHPTCIVCESIRSHYGLLILYQIYLLRGVVYVLDAV